MLNPIPRLFIIAQILLGSATVYAQTSPIILHPDGSQSTPPASADTNADGWPDDPFGISFVIQNGSSSPGLSTGGQMGYTGIANSLAVEFDAFYNPENGDSQGDHISVHTRGVDANDAHEDYSLGMSGAPSLTQGTRTAMVSYSSVTHTLRIYVGNFIVPQLTVPVDLETALNLSDGKAYIGIVSTTGDPDYTNGPNTLLSWSADFISDPNAADLRLLRVSGERADTGAAIRELDSGSPTASEDFDGGFEAWGQPDAYPFELEQQANANPSRGEYPRSFDVFFDQVVQASPNDDLAAPFAINLETFVEGGFPASAYNVRWTRESGSATAGLLISDGYTATLQFDASHPPVPGLYKIRCEVRQLGAVFAPPSRTAVAYILLPYAGPEITDWLIEEANYSVGGCR